MQRTVARFGVPLVSLKVSSGRSVNVSAMDLDRAMNGLCSRAGCLFQRTLVEKELETVSKNITTAQAAVTTIDTRVNAFIFGNFAFLCTQFGVLANWVFVSFDWNLVEPVTYFLGYTLVWMGVVFFRLTGKDFTYDAILTSIRDSKGAEKRRVLADLKDHRNLLMQKLRRNVE